MKPFFTKLVVLCFWLTIWQLISVLIHNPLILVGPIEIVLNLTKISLTKLFWLSIANTMLRIMLGFVTAFLVAFIISIASCMSSYFKLFIEPIIQLIKIVPVTSFILLVIVFLAKVYITSFIVFLMVLPIFYFNIVGGIRSVDRNLLELATIYKFSWAKRVKHIYLHSLKPYVVIAIKAGLGFSWKAGLTAEILALPRMSIGYELNNAKIYLDTLNLFSWTVVVVLLSLLFEYLIMWLLGKEVRHD